MKVLKSICLAVLSLLLIISAVQAIELSEAVKKLLDTHPDIASAKYLAEAGEARVKEAHSTYYPSLDMQYSAGLEDTYNSTTRNAGEGHKNLDPKGISLTLKQNIFSGFKTSHTVKKKRAEFEYAVLKLQQASEDLGLNAVTAYLNVLRDERLISLAEKNVAAHKSVLQLVTDKFTQGVGPEGDVSQASARMKSAQAALISLKRNLANSKASYQALIGEQPETLLTPAVPFEAVETDVESKIETALKFNPYLSGVYSKIASAQSDVFLNKSPFMPNLDMEAAYKHKNNASGIEGVNEVASLMLIMKYNLFSGGADYYKKQASITLRNKAESELAVAKRKVTELMQNSHNELEAATARLEAFTIQENESVKVKETYYDQFKVAKRSLLDLLNSENELFNARTDKTKEKFNEMGAVYKVLQNQGLLLKTLGLALPGNFALSD
jgi:outer membrane protein, adhesin transport system